ncbi:hypothetical protein C6Y40_03765 [Alteromonas alba]|uniref:HTH cro/C1-type domain-containing protein n=1 Tax=Alteromonas alba TaxID=2079529 RepID=A0A2S9VEN3_9ALTE|nr:helix-turn-helix transcriptional regulator [Alteromonas alba]PRO74922.1 hypothetical protein C6Y40_03765 [Alteromonas alba]
MNLLKAERERLGLKQSQVFEHIGVSKGTFIRWEQDAPIPSDKLAGLASLGFDINYVVTGKRSVNTKRVAEIVELIESLLVEHGRHVSPKGKARIIAGLLELEQESQQEVKASNVLPFVTAAGF